MLPSNGHLYVAPVRFSGMCLPCRCLAMGIHVTVFRLYTRSVGWQYDEWVKDWKSGLHQPQHSPRAKRGNQVRRQCWPIFESLEQLCGALPLCQFHTGTDLFCTFRNDAWWRVDKISPLCVAFSFALCSKKVLKINLWFYIYIYIIIHNSRSSKTLCPTFNKFSIKYYNLAFHVNCAI
jgi:hypothetical protein